MSARAFQNGLARLIVDPDYRDRVREQGRPALASDLTTKEARRLLRAAGDPGMDVTRMLHKGFRLYKLLARLPLTCALLPTASLATELGLFWQQRPPTTFYYLEEAIAFADHLLARSSEIDDPYLDDVATYERACLRLQLPPEADDSSDRESVRFRHDPSDLLPALRAGRRPSVVAELECLLVGSRGPDDLPTWTVEAAAGHGSHQAASEQTMTRSSASSSL